MAFRDQPKPPQCSERFSVGTVTDVNGNVLNAPLGIPDIGAPALTISTHLAASGEIPGCFTSFGTPWVGYLNYPAPNGQTDQIKLCFGTYPQLATSFGVPGIHEFQDNYSGHPFPGSYRQPVYLTNVILPDNTQWSLSYDSYGEITSVTTPTGSSIQYSWTKTTLPVCDSQDITSVSRAVKTRTLVDVNGNAFMWNYQWGTQAQDGTVTHTVTDPNGNDTVHIFKSIDPRPVLYPCNFHETQTVSYQGSGASRSAVQQVDITWNVNTYGVPGLPTDIRTTLLPSQKISLVHKDYDPNSPAIGVVISEKDYDWGQAAPGALLREQDTVYQWQKDGRYLTANLLVLPAFTIVVSPNGAANTKASCPVDAAGTTKACMAETDYTYDESGYLTPYENTVGALPAGTHVAAPNPVRGNLTTTSKWLNSGAAVVSHTYWYDTGMPVQFVDPLGHATTYSYDVAYNGALVTKTCNALNQCVTGTYDTNTGLLTSMTDANGTTPRDPAHTTSYGYDLMGRLKSVVSPADSAGNHPQTTFDYPNAVTTQSSRTITPSLNDHTTINSDGFGHVASTQHETPNGTVKVETSYDGLGHVASVKNPYYSTADSTYGSVYTIYDVIGRPTAATEQDGSIRSVDYSAGNCTVSTDEAGNQHRSCTDALGRLVEVDEPGDSYAGATAVGDLSVGGSLRYTSANASQATGSITITGSEGFRTYPGERYCADYSINGRCVDWEYTSSTTVYNSGTLVVYVNGQRFPYNYGAGDSVTSIANSLAAAIRAGSTSTDYSSVVVNNSVNPPVATIYLIARNAGAAGNNITLSFDQTTSDSIDFSGPSFSPGVSGPTLTGGASGGITGYDSGYAALSVGSFNGPSVRYSSTQNSNAADLAAAVAAAFTNAPGAPARAEILTPGSTSIRITYLSPGPAGNVAATLASTPDNAALYAGGSFSGSTTLSGGQNPTGPSLDHDYFVTLYGYDALGNLLSVTQKGDPSITDSSQWRVRSFTYDSLSRLLSSSNPESNTALDQNGNPFRVATTYSYDADGNLLMKTSPAPNQTGSTMQTVSYCYDELHRVTKEDYQPHTYNPPDCPITAPVVVYTYDSGPNAKGNLTGVTDQAGSASYSYDVLGRLASETRVIAGIPKSIGYDYNLDGSLNTLHYPSGAAVTYAPDSAGRILSAIDSANNINYATTATYAADGQMTGFVSGSSGAFAGYTNSFSYNKRLQPVNMSASAPGQTVFSIGYDFHAGNGTSGSGTDNGNVWNIYNYRDRTRDQAFNYDALNRLTSAQNAGTANPPPPSDCNVLVLQNKTKYWGNTYSYDAWGNLKDKNVSKCSAENLHVAIAPSNRISTAGYVYDSAGNMTADPTDGVTATYDPENRIATATKSGITTSYVYDSDGNRVEKVTPPPPATPASGTLYWYMTPGIVAESDLAGHLKSEYIFFNGDRVARRDFDPSTGAATGVFYYFSDHLKTASVITDSAGNIKAESDYYPWGGELQFVNADSNHYKSTGKERDSETQLDYFGARYYSSGLGRFITPDWDGTPVTIPYAIFNDPQTLNLYSYVRNNPVVRVDFDGHFDDPFGTFDGGGQFSNMQSRFGLVPWQVEGTVTTTTTRMNYADGTVVTTTTTDVQYTATSWLGTVNNSFGSSQSTCNCQLQIMSRPLQAVENSRLPSVMKWFVGIFARHLMLDITKVNGQEELVEGWKYGKQLGARILTDPHEIAEEKGTRSTNVGHATSKFDVGAIEQTANSFQRVPYHAVFGSNSNSVAHWLLQQGGVPGIFEPFGTPGWRHSAHQD